MTNTASGFNRFDLGIPPVAEPSFAARLAAGVVLAAAFVLAGLVVAVGLVVLLARTAWNATVGRIRRSARDQELSETDSRPSRRRPSGPTSSIVDVTAIEIIDLGAHDDYVSAPR
jgi:hypothetical protein